MLGDEDACFNTQWLEQSVCVWVGGGEVILEQPLLIFRTN